MSLYLWNVAIGQSFHFPLQAVEVALRNVIHTALIAELGHDWWLSGEGRRALGPERCEDIDKAAWRIRRKYEIEPHADQIVASLTFGFWASLLKRYYNSILWDRQTSSAFPFLGEETIGNVSRTANSIQNLRNRIFHHEPLIRRSLSEDYGAILRLVGWICPETREWVRRHSSVPIILRQRPR